MWNWFTALLWERWHRTALVFLIVILAPFGLSLLSVAFPDLVWFGDVWDTLSGWGSLGLIGFLLLAHSSLNDLHLGLDTQHFRLPVRTWRLAIVQLCCNMLLIVACGILVSVAKWLYANSVISSFSAELLFVDVLCRCLMLLSAYLILQCICWFLGSITVVGTLVLCAPLFLPLSDALQRFYGYGDVKVSVFRVSLLASIGILCFFLCLLAARWQRSGVLASFNMGRLRERLSLSFGSSREFASPLEAQAYYEWKRRGRLLPILFGATAFPAALISIPFPEAHMALWGYLDSLSSSSGYFFQITLEMQGTLLLSCAFAASLLAFAFAHRDRVFGVLTFIHTKPVSTLILARARTRAILRGTGWTLGLLLLALLPAVAIDPPDPHATVYFNSANAETLVSGVVLCGLILLTFLGYGAVVWIAFNHSVLFLFVLVISVAALLPLLSVVDVFAAHLNSAMRSEIFEMALALLAFIVGTVAASGLLLHARRKGWLTTRTLGALLALLPLVAACLEVSGAFDNGLYWYFRWEDVAFIAPLAPLAALPFAAWPMFITWQRHKR